MQPLNLQQKQKPLKKGITKMIYETWIAIKFEIEKALEGEDDND